MSQTELRQTNFDAVPLRNVVGVGNITAYQISVTRGKVLATIGSLEEFVNDSPANASRFENDMPEPTSVTPMRPWFRRVMSR
jgi:hypothetical protein